MVDRIKNALSDVSKKGLIIWTAAFLAVLLGCFAAMGLSAGEGRIFPVYISEVLAANTAFPNEEGRCCDFIELHNSADYPVDLTGFQLGDIGGGTRYAFPADTVMEPDSYMVIWCDKTVEGEAYAPFGISRGGGENFYLIASNSAVVDRVVTLAVDPDESMIRLEGDSWSLSAAVTPGRANDSVSAEQSDVYNSSVSPVRISEFSSGNTGYVNQYGVFCDWVELHNTGEELVDISGFTLSDNVGNDKYAFPAGTVLGAREYLLVYCSDRVADPAVAPFALNQDEEEKLVLKDGAGRIVEIVVSPAMESGAMALMEDGSWSAVEKSTPGFENSDMGHEQLLRRLGAVPGNIRITEVMAAAQAVLPDRYGEFSDWAELYNAGETAVDLAGWCLSDDPLNPGKWSFPSLVLEPGQRTVVFCSGRGTAGDGQVHTDFSLSAAGESLILSAPYGSIVDSVTLPETEAGCSVTFDGEAEMCADPTPGFSNDASGYEAFCASRTPAGPVAIWEVMVSNDEYLPQALGECYDWVELKNISDSSVSLSGYSLSDDPDIPGLHALADVTLQPGEAVAVILSGDESLSGRYDHAPFALNAAQDSLYLYGPNGELLDYVYLRDIPRGSSYGRSEEMGGFYYMQPTPEKSNAEGSRRISAEPVSEYAPGVYSADTGFTVTLEAEDPIYYTTDGSEPTTASQLYSGPVQLDSTAVLRAICVGEGKLPSEIYTATFIVGDTHDLPVVSLVTDPDYLWGRNGVYRNGDESVKEIRFPANVAYAGEDGSFSIDNEMSLHGATTVTAFNKKSFTVRFRDNYDGPLHYDVFEDGEVTVFSSLLIRTAHESTYSTQMHDTLMGAVAAECTDTVMSQKYKYVALYLNGEYWGLYALREHHSPEHYATYMDLPADSVQMVRYATDDYNTLRELYDFCAYNSFYSDENYAYAKSILDMESFADWIIFEAYVSNFDINSNMRYYRSEVDGLWRCGLSDLDLGMTGGTAGFAEVMNTFHHGRIVSALMENGEFQDLLAKRMAELLSGPLSEESLIARIDAMAAEIRQEAEWEEARWGTPVPVWESFVEDMKDFCDGRTAEMIESLRYSLGWTTEKAASYFGDLMG